MNPLSGDQHGLDEYEHGVPLLALLAEILPFHEEAVLASGLSKAYRLRVRELWVRGLGPWTLKEGSVGLGAKGS